MCNELVMQSYAKSSLTVKHFFLTIEDGSRKAWYEKIQDRQPKKKKVRKNTGPDEDDYEEFIDYIFPEDSAGEKNLKILQAAQAWKARKMAKTGS